jgi:uncharacterized membrane protein YfcA
MPDPIVTVTILFVFVLAGTVKGVIGLGLPTVSLALLSVAIDLPSAMALLLAPSFTTNVWQMLDGKNTFSVFKRIWPFLAMASMSVWIGAIALTQVRTSSLSVVLGALLIAYALTGLTGFRMTLSRNKEIYLGPILGLVNGVLTGMTGSFVVPGIMYLQSIKLSRDELIQAMGMLFTASTVALAIALQGKDLLTTDLNILSVMAVIPALLGMRIGKQLRNKLSEKRFKTLFFIALLLLGSYIAVFN